MDANIKMPMVVLDLPNPNAPEPIIEILAQVTPYHGAKNKAPDHADYLRFKDRNGDVRHILLAADMLAGPANKFKAALALKGFDWTTIPDAKVLIEDLQSRKAPARKITHVPGWHGDAYLMGNRWVTRDGSEPALYIPAPTVKPGPFLLTGSLAAWNDGIVPFMHASTFVTLGIALPLAAPLLRIANAPSFAVVTGGGSSTGKSSWLKLYACVNGQLDPRGLIALDGSLVGIEELISGSRDSTLHLDDLGQVLGSNEELDKFLKRLSFMSASSRTKERSDLFEMSRGVVKTDLRQILALTTEISPSAIATSASRNRLYGESVRMCELAIAHGGARDLFNKQGAERIVGTTTDERGQAADRMVAIAAANQGTLADAFIRKIVADPGVAEKITKGRTRFRQAVPQHSLPVVSRMRASFELCYAALDLAIRYGLIPYKADQAMDDIARCFENAVAQLKDAKTGKPLSIASTRDDQKLLEEFRAFMNAASKQRLELGEKADRVLRNKLKHAQVIRMPLKEGGATRSCLKAKRLREWFPNVIERRRLTARLTELDILVRKKNSSTPTQQLLRKPIAAKRRRYYVLRMSKLNDIA